MASKSSASWLFTQPFVYVQIEKISKLCAFVRGIHRASNAENVFIWWRHNVLQGVVLAGFIYSCELFPMADRTLAALFVQMSWMIGMFLLDFFAYFVRRWGHLMISISVPGVLIIPLFWWVNLRIWHITGLILGFRPASERRCYLVTRKLRVSSDIILKC